MPILKLKNFNGWETYVCKEAAIGPYFSSLLRQRINKKLACNVVVTGEPRLGKSYLATDIARVFEGRTRSGKERFTIEQIAYQFTGFMDLTMSLAIGKSIVFDEPSYAMGKRDWYKDINKALVLTIESKGFKVHPLFIPIINKALLDKTIRSYLIQFQVELRDRGRADVYRIMPSQITEKVYRTFLCRLNYNLFDNNLCKQDSCLGCEQLSTCQIFRAQYERRKESIQDVRYEKAQEEAQQKESKELSLSQILDVLRHDSDVRLSWEREKELDAIELRIILRDRHHISVSRNTIYEIRKTLMREFKDAETT